MGIQAEGRHCPSHHMSSSSRRRDDSRLPDGGAGHAQGHIFCGVGVGLGARVGEGVGEGDGDGVLVEPVGGRAVGRFW